RRHRPPRTLHLQHGDGGADGAGGPRRRRRARGLTLSLRDDRGPGRLDRVHDAHLVARQYPGGRPRQLHVRRLRPHRRALLGDRHAAQRPPGVLAAPALSAVMDTPSNNTRVMVFDGMCTMAMNAFLVGPFVAAFAFALGASHRDIGLIASIAFLSMPM